MSEAFREKLSTTFLEKVDIESLERAFVNLFNLYFETILQIGTIQQLYLGVTKIS